MFRSTLALAAVAAVSAAPVERAVAIPLKLVSSVSSAANLVQRGQARIERYNGASHVGNVDASSGSVTNEDVSYVADVSIGGSTWSLIVDTGCTLTSRLYS